MVTKSFIIRQDSAFNIVGIRVHLPSESAFNIRRRTQLYANTLKTSHI